MMDSLSEGGYGITYKDLVGRMRQKLLRYDQVATTWDEVSLLPVNTTNMTCRSPPLSV